MATLFHEIMHREVEVYVDDILAIKKTDYTASIEETV
jgi:hypothetical protein